MSGDEHELEVGKQLLDQGLEGDCKGGELNDDLFNVEIVLSFELEPEDRLDKSFQLLFVSQLAGQVQTLDVNQSKGLRLDSDLWESKTKYA